MLVKTSGRTTPAVGAVLVSLALVLTLFWLEADRSFSLWDEGFLWYGAQRVLRGEVPLRDFMAYDPGRYYWSAAVMKFAGSDGIMQLRLAIAVVQAIGLWLTLKIIGESVDGKDRNPTGYLLMAGIILALWMFPRHKMFDITTVCFLISALTGLVREPKTRNWFTAGVAVGFAAFIGRNHGIYGVVGGVGVTLWLALGPKVGTGRLRGVGASILGVLLGYAPELLMIAFVPGFGPAFWGSIQELVQQGATNLPLVIPWPWTIKIVGQPPGDAIRSILIGLFFVATLIFGPAAIYWSFWTRRRGTSPCFVACAFLAIPYAHFAFSRADLSHLAQGIFPVLVGVLVLLARQPAYIRWPSAGVLFLGSLWVTIDQHPGWQCRSGTSCVETAISGSILRIDPGTASDVALLRKLAGHYAPDGQTFIAVPFWPGAYALLNRRAPMTEIYPLFAQPPAFERREIAHIQAARPGFAIIFDMALDGRNDLRFSKTHPLTTQFILDHSDPVTVSPEPAYQTFVMRRMPNG